MDTPDFGFCFPVRIAHVRDADTVVAQINGSAFVWALRLIDVWAPEIHTANITQRQQAMAAKQWVEDELDEAVDIRAFIPLPPSKNIFAAMTFDRVPAYLWVDGKLFNRRIIEAGYASSTKEGKLGA